MIIEIKQEFLDREMAPCYLCSRCGDEVYSFEKYDLYDGLCEQCFFEQEEEDE